MTTYRVNGRRIDRDEWEKLIEGREGLVAPRVSRFEPMESPVTGEIITSWRQRDADMKAADAYDPRDVKSEPARGRKAQSRDKANGRSESIWK